MTVCIVLIWFLLTSLQESGNLDVIFKVRRKIKYKISKLFFLFLVKSQLFEDYFYPILILYFFTFYETSGNIKAPQNTLTLNILENRPQKMWVFLLQGTILIHHSGMDQVVFDLIISGMDRVVFDLIISDPFIT